MKTKFLFLFLTGLLTFSSCIKEENQIDEPDTPTPSNYDLYSNVNADVDLTVRVLNESNTSVQGALVTFGSTQATTDEFGIAQFSNESVDSKRAHVDVSYNGYFKADRNFNPVDGENYVNIKLVPRQLIGSFETGVGGSLSLSSGPTLDFSAGDLQAADGSSYSGTVNVYSAFLNPTANDFGQTVPGDLFGMEGMEVSVLESYGMIGVELEGSAGETLNLGDGQEAVLTYPVQSALQANAPQNINLWFYNTQTDIWESDGMATLTGNTYVANVSHFTWWNIDIPMNFVDLEFTLVNSEGTNAGNVDFGLCFNSFTATGTTNSNGLFEGPVPVNEILTLKTYDYCGQVVFSMEIGPFSSNTDLGDIVVPAGDMGYPIIGSAIDCDGNPVTSGYAVLQEVGSVFSQVVNLESDGTFNFGSVCSSDPLDYNLIIADTDNGFLSEAIIFTYVDGSANDLGEIDVCDQVLSEYFTLVFEGVEYNTFSNTSIYNSASCFHINANDIAGAASLYLSIEDIGMAGIANECSVDSVGFFNVGNTAPSIFINLNSAEADISDYSTAFGEYLIGTYSAEYEAQSIYPAGTITGTFSILND